MKQAAAPPAYGYSIT